MSSVGGQHVLDLAGPMPKASAEGAVGGGVAVAADRVWPGRVMPSSGPILDDPLAGVLPRVERDAELRAVRFSARSGFLRVRGFDARPRPSVGALWSAVAKVWSGRRTGGPPGAGRRRPAAR